MLPLSSTRYTRYPALWIACAITAGVLAARLFPMSTVLWLSTAAVLACAAVLLRSCAWSRVPLVLACCALGAGLYQQSQHIQPDRLRLLYDSGTIDSGTAVEAEGILTGRPETSADGEFLNIGTVSLRWRGEEKSVSGVLRAFVPLPAIAGEEAAASKIARLRYGSRVRVACALEREEQYLNPGVQSHLELLDRMGVDATCIVKSQLLVEHLADESVFLPLAWVYDRRGELIDSFRENLPPRTAGVMIASLLGNRYFLDKETADVFREGGTFHILVISGLHITFIGGLLLLILRSATRNRWVQFLLTAICLWGYTLAVGADVPVVRASIMFTIVLLGYAMHRRSTLLNSLGICAIVLLVWRPADLFDPSFQLTFVSVAAIVALAYPLIEALRKVGSWSPTPSEPFPPNTARWLVLLCETLYWDNDIWLIEQRRQIWSANVIKAPVPWITGILQRITRYAFEAIVVSLIVQFTMLPLSVIYFHRVSIGSVVLNIWVSSFIAIESFAAVIGAVVSSWNHCWQPASLRLQTLPTL